MVLCSLEVLSSSSYKTEQFLRGSLELLGLLVGLTLEGSPVESWPKHFLLDPLSRSTRQQKGLLPRVKANIGIMCFDLKKMWGSGEGPEGRL